MTTALNAAVSSDLVTSCASPEVLYMSDCEGRLSDVPCKHSDSSAAANPATPRPDCRRRHPRDSPLLTWTFVRSDWTQSYLLTHKLQILLIHFCFCAFTFDNNVSVICVILFLFLLLSCGWKIRVSFIKKQWMNCITVKVYISWKTMTLLVKRSNRRGFICEKWTSSWKMT